VKTSSRLINVMRRLHRAMLWTLALILTGCLAGAAVVLTADAVLAIVSSLARSSSTLKASPTTELANPH